MNILNARDELVREEENRLQGEFTVAEVEQVLQAGTEEIENHSIVVALSSKPTDKGDADTTSKRLVDTCLIFKLGMFGLDTLQLDSNLFARDNVCTQVNISEATATDLPANTVLVTYAKIL